MTAGAVRHNRKMEKPKIVSAEEGQQARGELLTAEKEATRALDAIAARRRRLPMVRFAAEYSFDTPDGTKTLLDLFEGRQQLVVYQFMDNGPDDYCPGCTMFTRRSPLNPPDGTKTLLDLFEGRQQLVVYQFMDNGPDDYCPGCTMFTSSVPAASPGQAGGVDVTWGTVSTMPIAQIEAYKARKGWTVPFVSSRGTSFADDCGAGDGFMLSVFLRDGDQVYRTYSTTARGVDRLALVKHHLYLHTH